MDHGEKPEVTPLRIIQDGLEDIFRIKLLIKDFRFYGKHLETCAFVLKLQDCNCGIVEARQNADLLERRI